MPLDCEDRVYGVCEGFNRAVGSLTNGEKPFSEGIDSLMMGGVDESAASVQLIKEICAAASDVIYIVELVFSIPLMGSRIFNMLTNRTAKMNVDDLHALTDTEYGFVPLDEKIKGLKLNDIQFCINLPGTMIVLSEKGRGNVSAAGKQQSVAVCTLFGV